MRPDREMTIDHALLAHVLRTVDAASGERRAWVKSSRILDAVVGASIGSLEEVLHDPRWWSRPEVGSLVALIDLIRRDLVDGRGNFGRGFETPADPIYCECRRVDRPLAELLARVAAIDEPGSLVTRFDPRRLDVDDGVGPVRIGAPLPAAVEPPWHLDAEPEPGDYLLYFHGAEAASVRVIDGVVALLAPLVTGVTVAGLATVGESATALRARWGADLIGERGRVWHRERPELVVWIADTLDLVLSVQLRDRDR